MKTDLEKCYDTIVKDLNEDIKDGLIILIRKGDTIHLEVIDEIGLAIKWSLRLNKRFKKFKKQWV